MTAYAQANIYVKLAASLEAQGIDPWDWVNSMEKNAQAGIMSGVKGIGNSLVGGFKNFLSSAKGMANRVGIGAVKKVPDAPIRYNASLNRMNQQYGTNMPLYGRKAQSAAAELQSMAPKKMMPDRARIYAKPGMGAGTQGPALQSSQQSPLSLLQSTQAPPTAAARKSSIDFSAPPTRTIDQDKLRAATALRRNKNDIGMAKTVMKQRRYDLDQAKDYIRAKRSLTPSAAPSLQELAASMKTSGVRIFEKMGFALEATGSLRNLYGWVGEMEKTAGLVSSAMGGLKSIGSRIAGGVKNLTKGLSAAPMKPMPAISPLNQQIMDKTLQGARARGAKGIMPGASNLPADADLRTRILDLGARRAQRQSARQALSQQGSAHLAPPVRTPALFTQSGSGPISYPRVNPYERTLG